MGAVGPSSWPGRPRKGAGGAADQGPLRTGLEEAEPSAVPARHWENRACSRAPGHPAGAAGSGPEGTLGHSGKPTTPPPRGLWRRGAREGSSGRRCRGLWLMTLEGFWTRAQVLKHCHLMSCVTWLECGNLFGALAFVPCPAFAGAQSLGQVRRSRLRRRPVFISVLKGAGDVQPPRWGRCLSCCKREASAVTGVSSPDRWTFS